MPRPLRDRDGRRIISGPGTGSPRSPAILKIVPAEPLARAHARPIRARARTSGAP
jgi:hypothetical protein